MYKRKIRLSPKRHNRLLDHLLAETTVRVAAEIIGVQLNTAIRFLMRLRFLMASQLPSYELNGEVEADESYFGRVRKGKRSRGAAGKVALFGLFKWVGKVFTAIVPNAKTETLLPIIEERVIPNRIVYTDTFKAYNAFDVTEFHHICINHSKLFADRANHVNGIENFCSQAKRHLRRFNGIKPNNFHWFLKECEWCFNGGNHLKPLQTA